MNKPMPKSTADPTPNTVKVTHSFNHPPERVFDAWLNPDSAKQWLFATPTGKMVRSEIDPRIGGKFAMVDRRDGEDIEHVGQYRAIDRPRRLQFSFAVPKFSDQETDVTVDLAPTKEGSDVTLTHSGVQPDYVERTGQGWSMILAGLAKTLG